MKVFLTILTVALVAQVSFAATIQRSKRETEDAVELMKEIVEEEYKMVDAVFKEIPKTAAYKKFRDDWQTYFDLYKRKDLLCPIKMEGLMEGFGEWVGSYRAPDAPAEAKEMLKLFEKHGLDAHIVSTTSKVEQMKDVDVSKFFNTC